MSYPLKEFISLLHFSEGLKRELRHSWLSNDRQESVAEHSWRLAFMVMLSAPYFPEISVEKAIKMALVHDLAEAETGDVPLFAARDPRVKAEKIANEMRAMLSLREHYKKVLGEDIYTLWHEYETKSSLEARLVTALDKLEAQIQHNEASIDTWLAEEKHYVNGADWLNQYCEFHPFLRELQVFIQQEAKDKIAAACIQPSISG